jgi:predicted protein tyrosine phosphatase
VSVLTPGPLVPFEITICGIDELPSHTDRGVTHVLTLLDPGWPSPDALATLGARQYLDLRFYDIIDPHPGLAAPEIEHVERLLAFGRGLANIGTGHLLVHCHMGISRSSAATFLLLAQARPDRAAGELLAEIVRIRPHAWPNLRIVELGDAMMARDGELIAATVERYRDLLRQRPKLRGAMARLGRARELAAADAV